MDKLLPCPFCGGTNTRSGVSGRHWTGMRYVIISWAVEHWCERGPGQPQSFISIRGKTQEEAERLWNSRVGAYAAGP
jgi:hypothetical protein